MCIGSIVVKKQAFKFLLEPNKNHISDFLVFAGSCRFVYNKGLALINEVILTRHLRTAFVS
ncbi:helix-turn-helix domain-containing protein [Leclercia adecarboxylata]|uniref:helix-turn-helix domain-containing protein n=1 Tax=Leclercia adecarboxylata TaxID=83655 RepID=UPI0030B9B398